MFSSWSFFLFLAFALSAFCTAFVRRIALRYGVVDVPDGRRKRHQTPTALLGGISPYLGFCGAVLPVLLSTTVLTSGDLSHRHILGVLFAGGVLMIGGVIDDIWPQPARITILFPLLASIIAIFSGLGFAKLTNPFGTFFVIPSVLSGILTFVWLMGMTYTTKLLDGVDGLVSSVSLVGTAMIAALALSASFYQPDVAILALMFFFAIAGFLLWNFPPAKVYLGEGGSTFLGFTLGALAVIGGSKTMTLLLVLGLPALDVAYVTVTRFLEGKSVFSADRSHLHLRLIDAGWSVRAVLALYVGTGVVFGVTTLVFQSWEKLIAFGVLVSLALCGMILLSYKRL